MRELLGDLGFRHTKEEVLEPAARVPGTPNRRLGQNPRGAATAMVVGAKLGFEERYLCVLGGSPAPSYIGGGAGGQGEGVESLPNSSWVVRRLGEEGLPPQLGFTSFSSFPLSKFSRLTFQFSYLTFQTRI